MTNEEIRDLVSDDIKEVLNSYIGVKPSTKDVCEKIRSVILGYLEELKLTQNMTRTPTVKVEHEGPFITVNFFDKDGNRLESLEDMLSYMNVVL